MKYFLVIWVLIFSCTSKQEDTYLFDKYLKNNFSIERYYGSNINADVADAFDSTVCLKIVCIDRSRESISSTENVLLFSTNDNTVLDTFSHGRQKLIDISLGEELIDYSYVGGQTTVFEKKISPLKSEAYRIFIDTFGLFASSSFSRWGDCLIFHNSPYGPAMFNIRKSEYIDFCRSTLVSPQYSTFCQSTKYDSLLIISGCKDKATPAQIEIFAVNPGGLVIWKLTISDEEVLNGKYKLVDDKDRLFIIQNNKLTSVEITSGRIKAEWNFEGEIIDVSAVDDKMIVVENIKTNSISNKERNLRFSILDFNNSGKVLDQELVSGKRISFSFSNEYLFVSIDHKISVYSISSLKVIESQYTGKEISLKSIRDRKNSALYTLTDNKLYW